MPDGMVLEWDTAPFAGAESRRLGAAVTHTRA